MGGGDLSLGDVRNTLGLVAKYLPADAEQLTAAGAHPDWQGTRQLCVLTIKYSEAAEEKPSRKPARPRPEPLPVDEPAAVWEQQTLDLDPVSKGIMERTTPVIWNNEDLDEPTYKRRKLMIDDGRKSPGKRR